MENPTVAFPGVKINTVQFQVRAEKDREDGVKSRVKGKQKHWAKTRETVK